MSDTPLLSRPWRWFAYAVVVFVLAGAFWAYLRPDMVLNWETLMTLCGFD